MQSSTFALQIADTIFGEPPSTTRASLEAIDVQRFKDWISRNETTVAMVRSKSGVIDRGLIANFSAPSMLEVARMIEVRCPDVIAEMPQLRGHQDRLQRAHTLSQVFMASSMSMLVRALEEEGNR